MTAASAVVRRMLSSRITVWVAFAIVHVVLGALCLFSTGFPMGDVSFVYRPWALQAAHGMPVVGIDTPWVYPIVALVPILLPAVLGSDGYDMGWLVLVTLLNAGALAALLWHPRRRRLIAAWWWLGFLALLGPIALARIDTVSVAIAIVAIVWLRSRLRVAAVLLTIATWVKVWPAALLAALVVASRRRLHVVWAAIGTSVVIVALALAFGAGVNIVSFVTQQTSRGMQIESVVSTVWMWLAHFRVAGGTVYYDRELLTFQVTGDGASLTAMLMTPMLAIAAAVIALLGVRARHAGAPITRVLPPLALALVTAFIVVNKVGSPQFVAWLAVPLMLGILVSGAGFRTPAVLGLVTAALTHLFYPYLYGALLASDTTMLVVLTARNVVFVALLTWSVIALWKAGNARITVHGSAASTLTPTPLSSPKEQP